jgi:hypothetical protein
MSRITQFGNRLYTGETSFNFIGRGPTWYLLSSAVILVAVVMTVLRGGFTFGIEFRGGSEFQISNPSVVDVAIAEQTVTAEAGDVAAPKTAIVGGSTVRVQTEQLTTEATDSLRVALAEAYEVPLDRVKSSFVGATWGADITNQALRALVVFLILVSIVMALYFRTWKMSVAAVVAVVHDHPQQRDIGAAQQVDAADQGGLCGDPRHQAEDRAVRDARAEPVDGARTASDAARDVVHATARHAARPPPEQPQTCAAEPQRARHARRRSAPSATQASSRLAARARPVTRRATSSMHLLGMPRGRRPSSPKPAPSRSARARPARRRRPRRACRDPRRRAHGL